MDDAELAEIAIGQRGVRSANGQVVAIEGSRLVTQIAIGATFYIMCQHALVGVSVAAVIFSEKDSDAVRCERLVDLVLRIGEQEQTAHLQGLGHRGRFWLHSAEQAVGRIGLFPHQTVGCGQVLFKCIVAGASRQHGN